MSVEDSLLAVGSDIGSQNILAASKINKAIVLFLRQVDMDEG